MNCNSNSRLVMIQSGFTSAALCLSALSFSVCVCRVDAAEPPAATKTGSSQVDDAGAQFFTTKIRPLLSRHCYSCHSQKAIKVKGGLRLDSRQGILKGGESGAVIVPGKPEESPLTLAL